MQSKKRQLESGEELPPKRALVACPCGRPSTRSLLSWLHGAPTQIRVCEACATFPPESSWVAFPAVVCSFCKRTPHAAFSKRIGTPARLIRQCEQCALEAAGDNFSTITVILNKFADFETPTPQPVVYKLPVPPPTTPAPGMCIGCHKKPLGLSECGVRLKADGPKVPFCWDCRREGSSVVLVASESGRCQDCGDLGDTLKFTTSAAVIRLCGACLIEPIALLCIVCEKPTVNKHLRKYAADGNGYVMICNDCRVPSRWGEGGKQVCQDCGDNRSTCGFVADRFWLCASCIPLANWMQLAHSAKETKAAAVEPEHPKCAGCGIRCSGMEISNKKVQLCDECRVPDVRTSIDSKCDGCGLAVAVGEGHHVHRGKLDLVLCAARCLPKAAQAKCAECDKLCDNKLTAYDLSILLAVVLCGACRVPDDSGLTGCLCGDCSTSSATRFIKSKRGLEVALCSKCMERGKPAPVATCGLCRAVSTPDKVEFVDDCDGGRVKLCGKCLKENELAIKAGTFCTGCRGIQTDKETGKFKDYNKLCKRHDLVAEYQPSAMCRMCRTYSVKCCEFDGTCACAPCLAFMSMLAAGDSSVKMR